MTLSDDVKTVRTTSLGWMIQRVARRLDSEMERRLARLDLSLPQFAVMMTVLEHDGQTQAEIGQAFSMPAYAISRALDHLEGAGYVERCPHPTSRRALIVNPTDRGQRLGPELFAIVAEVNDVLVKGLSAQERATFGALLARLI